MHQHHDEEMRWQGSCPGWNGNDDNELYEKHSESITIINWFKSRY